MWQLNMSSVVIIVLQKSKQNVERKIKNIKGDLPCFTTF